MLALVGVALAAVVLVGAGVLFFTQIGARASARSRVLDQLEVLAELTDNANSDGTIDRVQPAIGRLGEAFDASDADIVVVTDRGRVVTTTPDRRKQINLSPLEVDALDDGPVLIDGRGEVIGLTRITARIGRGPLADQPLAILVSREVVSVSSSARWWFLASAAGVLLLSLAVARWLADRFTRPLLQIEMATARIAAGDLQTRVEVDGDDELAALGNAVNRMATDLGRSRAVEQEFLMSVSHDLRTPLTAINGYAEALTDGAVDDPVAAGTVIAANAQRLSRLVGDLLDLARLNARQFRLEPQLIDLTELAAIVVEDHSPRATGLGVALEASGNVRAPVMADPDRVAQVVGNLIDNALKFADSRIEVRVEVGDHEALLSVIDDGPGIPQQDVPFVFERLYVTRLKPLRAENSSGLGLAIVKELAGAMGGTVSAESHNGLGTTMRVRLPLAH